MSSIKKNGFLVLDEMKFLKAFEVLTKNTAYLGFVEFSTGS